MTQAFNLSQFANKVNTSGQADLTTAVTGTLPVANGGTGATTLTSGNVLIGAGTSAVTSVAASTSGNVLTSNGTTWVSQAVGGGSLQAQLFTAPGTWTKPSSCTQVIVTVIGGGGGAALGPNPSYPGSTGGTSSFGSAVSATGGLGNGFAGGGTPGSSTVSTGTSLKSGFGFPSAPNTSSGVGSFGSIAGTYRTPTGNASSVTYSASSTQIAGAGGIGNAYSSGCPGLGGIAQAIVPVSAPVAVTVGAGGAQETSGNVPAGYGGGGAVLVEFVG